MNDAIKGALFVSAGVTVLGVISSLVAVGTLSTESNIGKVTNVAGYLTGVGCLLYGAVTLAGVV